MKNTNWSFTHIVKDEVANIALGSNNESIAELHAFLSVNGNLVLKDGNKYLSTSTDNEITAQRIYAIFKNLFGKNFPIDVLVQKEQGKYGLSKYQILINEELGIMKQLGLNILGNKNFLEKVLKDKEAFCSFFRGLFLASGSINNPETIFYHLEIVIENKEHATFIQKIINDFRDFEFKVIKRRNRFVVYAKKAENISDFMKLIGAQNTLLEFENTRIERDFKNSLNRIQNMDIANLEKTIKASSDVIKIINKLKKINNLEFLDDKGKAIAEIRINEPEINYSEIAQKYSKKHGEEITKSGVNHIIRKIKQNYKKYKEE